MVTTRADGIFGGFVAYVSAITLKLNPHPYTFLQGISFSTSTFAPYKIIYLLLGGLALVVGVCVLIWMPDSPVHARMLTREERIAAIERVRDDQSGTENRRLKKEQVWEAVTDVRTWLIVLTTFLSGFNLGY